MIRALATIGTLQFFAMLLLLARTKILAVMLGPEAVGTIAVIDKLTAVIVGTLSLSLPFAALRFLPAALRESPQAMDVLYRRMRTVLLAIIAPATLICIAVSLVAASTWGRELAAHQRVLVLAFAAMPVLALVPFLTNAYAGSMAHNRAMIFTIAHAGVLVLAALAAGLGGGLAGFYGTYAALGAVLVVVAARSVAQLDHAERVRISLPQAFRLPRAVWRFAAALAVLGFASPYAALFVQYRALTLYGAVGSGILQSAIGISLSVRVLLGTAHAVFLTPHVNREGEPRARMAWANDFQRATVLLFIIALPPLLLFPDVALRVMYSGKFVGAAAFVALFIATEVFTLLSGTYQSLIIAGDRMLFHVIQNLTAQALLIGVAAFAIPRLGLAGAGVAALTAPLFLYATTLLFLRRRYDIHVSGEARLMALVTAGIVVIGGSIGSRYPGLSAGLLVMKAAACGLIWLGAYLIIPAPDRSRLRDGGARLKREVFLRTARLMGTA
ncbi:MAG TPA: hypothetical protein VID74_09670 [Gemmatimonadales bacterium]